ncbi:TlpA disulfide reductase family protein [uncultured Thiothrix sp.]|uniref:TlpA family protein disulfide reductase n=1 Tax=uncultured Thiothrix sp. TaxID=223185 RepID=UPI00260633A8|nr:TlpA disulfide reductase family protein [uncultured Thiothrix sp.]HMT92264.1 TlpA disulfide reductase family protein [Thiolinea sp.]
MNKRLATQMLSIITLLCTWLLITSPATAMTDLQGQPVKLETIVGKGKWTVMKIWAADCHVCRQTIHYLTDFEVSFPEAAVYGISIDGQAGKAEAQAFVKQYNLDFPNLLSDLSEMNAYLNKTAGESLYGTPTMLVFNPQGKLIAVQPGPVTADELIAFIKKEQQS